MSIFKKLIPMILIFIFEIVIGVLMFIDGERFTQISFIIFGGLLLLCGIITLIKTLVVGKRNGVIPLLPMVMAIVLLALGAFFTASSESVMSIMSALWIVIGIIMAFSGMIKLFEFATLRGAGARVGFAIIGAIVTIVVGIVIAFNPFGATETAWKIFAIMIIISAVFDLISMIIYAVKLKNADVTVVEVKAKELNDK